MKVKSGPDSFSNLILDRGFVGSSLILDNITNNDFGSETKLL